jgi:putative hydrolase of the HAD superfamily
MPKVLKEEFRHIENWVFDMDGTLYPPDNGLEDALWDSWYDFFKKRCGYSREEVDAKSAIFEKAYEGNLFYGWMIEENVSFEEIIHVFDSVDHSFVERCERTKAGVEALPGRKFIFTNAHFNRIDIVLERLGLLGHFDGLFYVRKMDDVVKPNPLVYDRFCAIHAVNPKTSIFFEDSVRNLKPAHEMGMKTVLLHKLTDKNPEYVDYTSDSVADWLSSVWE